VSAEWVAARLDQPGLVLLQVGRDSTYAERHLPGARRVTLDDISLPDEGEDALALQLPEPDRLRRTLARFGVTDASTVVVVHSDGQITQAARVLATLDWAGLGDRAHLLDGGLEGWEAAGHPVSAGPSEEVDDLGADTAPSVTVAPRQDRTVTSDWLVAGGADAPGFALVDGRAAPFWAGEREDRGGRGHIPGAASVPAPELFESVDGVTRLLDTDALRERFRAAGVEEGDTVVAYCHIGQYASMVMLAARVLGHDVRLYDGSMDEWARLGLPRVLPPPGGGGGPG
jgi:thiosulfate/3-mercaptopyruvate sulfurtransferase